MAADYHHPVRKKDHCVHFADDLCEIFYYEDEIDLPDEPRLVSPTLNVTKLKWIIFAIITAILITISAVLYLVVTKPHLQAPPPDEQQRLLRQFKMNRTVDDNELAKKQFRVKPNCFFAYSLIGVRKFNKTICLYPNSTSMIPDNKNAEIIDFRLDPRKIMAKHRALKVNSKVIPPTGQPEALSHKLGVQRGAFIIEPIEFNKLDPEMKDIEMFDTWENLLAAVLRGLEAFNTTEEFEADEASRKTQPFKRTSSGAVHETVAFKVNRILEETMADSAWASIVVETISQIYNSEESEESEEITNKMAVKVSEQLKIDMQGTSTEETFEDATKTTMASKRQELEERRTSEAENSDGLEELKALNDTVITTDPTNENSTAKEEYNITQR
ncbi:uncharacterized protein LOC114245741 [Bombyx mandarina]|uniref:Uncharacterized protein LOC114245741 n=1 Tax=Bombyx mandarina TaxID=7092 RepID=A0A6J2JW82_BOMMA|nr:uncharacterized protein LOC114245741 [Bombyx mandarina]